MSAVLPSLAGNDPLHSCMFELVILLIDNLNTLAFAPRHTKRLGHTETCPMTSTRVRP